MASIGSLFGLDAGKATQKAAGMNQLALTALRNAGLGYINTGEQKSEGALNSAIDSYDPWVGTGTKANTLYADALGLNGAEGNAAATEAFQTSPGYDWARENALRGSERAAAASGMLASGNTLAALQDRSAQVANQEWGGWLDRVNGVSGQGLNAASGQAQGYTNLGNLYQGTTNQRVGLDSAITAGWMDQNIQKAEAQEANSAAWGNIGATIGNLATRGFKGFWG